MISKKDRDNNKSRGPWGLKDYIISYKKNEEDIDRSRFITASDEESAKEQLIYILEKEGISPIILSIEESSN